MHFSRAHPFHNRACRAAKVLLVAWCVMLGQSLPVLAQEEIPAAPAGPEPGRARLVVDSDPTGLVVVLDGRLDGPITPAILDVPPGQHRLLLDAAGYQPLSHTVQLVEGQVLELKFLMISTPPEPPDPAELRAMAEELMAGSRVDPVQDVVLQKERALCLDCHPLIPGIQEKGVHAAVSCAGCHDDPSTHVQGGKVVGRMTVVDGDGIPVLCMTCHDEKAKARPGLTIRRIDPAKHLRDKNVSPRASCARCHHVHSPMTWVHEARDMVGLPPLVATVPLLDEKLALDARERFNSLGQTFLIFPLASGLIGVTAFKDDPDYPANQVFLSGLVLVAGSFLLGKMAFNRKMQEIRAVNAERTEINNRAKEYKLKLDRARANYNRQVAEWQRASDGRGRVQVVSDSAAR